MVYKHSKTQRRMPVPKYLWIFGVLSLAAILGTIVTVVFSYMTLSSQRGSDTDSSIRLFSLSPAGVPTDESCLFHTCTDVYRCGRRNDDNRIAVYIYPTIKGFDEHGVPIMLPPSKEFIEVLNTIESSVYYTSNPNEACIFVPRVDVLNENMLRIRETGQYLSSLSWWNEGKNHLLFNMMPGVFPDYNATLDVPHGKAILAGGGYSDLTYRRTFDVSIPVFNPLTAGRQLARTHSTKPLARRSWLLVSAQVGLHQEYISELVDIAALHSDFLLLETCGEGSSFYERCRGQRTFSYPDVLQDAVFCLVLRGARLGQTMLSDAMQAGCIPVIVADSYVLPFSEVLDWQRAALVVSERNLPKLMDIIRQVTAEQRRSLQRQTEFLWQNYMSSMRVITLTTLQIINDRFFPQSARSYDEWNELVYRPFLHNPLQLPILTATPSGFTAVILSYDRVQSLFTIIQQLAACPSLVKVLVVWNNQVKAPPSASAWPKINRPLKVIQATQNRLSNRFYPYDEIETEAVFALDDDILMLTTDEVEFAYAVWREFPDRLVGFPSRLHLWDAGLNRWKYESEWTSDISIVLTGAAFYHKYYNYLYTNAMPGGIKRWVDEHMNCEDIAMNFVVANATGKAALKVTPRQKFRCPDCQNFTVLSADLPHMVERSECINRFATIYGYMPLRTVEFRVDPLLYKDNVPAALKKFADVGSL